MALSRANVESILVQRVGPLMAAAGMAVTATGSNANLNDPIGRAIRALGYTTADVTLVADSDVAQVAVSKYDEFFDLGEYYTLEAILGNYDDVDIIVGPRSERLSQTIGQLENKIAAKLRMLERLYGRGLAIPSGGVITLNIAEHD